MKSIPVIIHTVLFRLILLLPAGAAYLPGFQTGFVEDVLLLILPLYLLLRGANRDRVVLDAGLQPVLITIVLAVIYGIVWLGLVRGYFDSWGRWLAVYPLLLAAAVYLRGMPLLPESSAYRLLLKSVVVLSFFSFLMLVLWSRIIVKADNPYYLLEKHTLVPALCVLPVIGLCALLSRSVGRIQRGREHIPYLLLALFVALPVWVDNAETWTLWYRAGMEERAWTPYKHDRVMRPEAYAEADYKPYSAARYYHLVYQRLQKKGDLPQYWNWNFFMKYRIAFQARRKENAVLCAETLPVRSVDNKDHLRLLKRLWHQEFLWDVQDNEPAFKRKESIYVDFEIDPARTNYYAMDCFGRVFSINDSRPWQEWEPDELFTDAIDLEIDGETFIILRADGSILTSQPYPLFDGNIPAIPAGQKPVDLELLPDRQGAVMITDFGQMISFGNLPDNFPGWGTLFFGSPVVADMELEPEGRGYYLLDIYGGLHANLPEGVPSFEIKSPPIPRERLPYWLNQNMAVDLEIDPFNRGVYVYSRTGELSAVSLEPFRENFIPETSYPYRGVGIAAGSDGALYAMESNGRLVLMP